ncbi:MAG: DUF4381 domain-containing protein [Alphaproteobacteria bacterium]|nr:DUF4381 domain-containing protein [Alphaproteobacteria bacterium]
MDTLPELRDIHLPSEDISIFPLAYGWWYILAGIAVLAVSIYVIHWIRRTSALLYARHLLKPLKDSNNIEAAVKMSEILRRICVRKYPEAVALADHQWIEFINSKTRKPLQGKVAELLKNAPFVPEDSRMYTSADVADLWLFCNRWIGENL